MMRQYELVERVQRYKPDVNEALLNRAYVYAMQKHGHQKRASGDPYFSHPLEVAAILTDMHLDEATIAVALLHDTIEDTTATAPGDRRAVRPRHRQAGRGADQAEEARSRLEEGRAGGEPAQAAAGDLRGCPRAPGQARRPAAQHAHARPRAGRTSALRIAEETMEIYAPLAGRMGMQGMREELEELAFRTINPEAYRTVTERLGRHLREEPRRGRRDRAGAVGAVRQARHQGRGEEPPEEAVVGVPQDGSQGALLRAAVRHLRLPRRRRHGRGLLPRARRRPHDLVDGAGPLQGLHLDAEAERLPLDPHHHRRPVAPAHRAADPHRAR